MRDLLCVACSAQIDLQLSGCLQWVALAAVLQKIPCSSPRRGRPLWPHPLLGGAWRQGRSESSVLLTSTRTFIDQQGFKDSPTTSLLRRHCRPCAACFIVAAT